jgi:hypothetical protein
LRNGRGVWARASKECMEDAQELRALRDDPASIPDAEMLLRIVQPGFVDFSRKPYVFQSNAFQDQDRDVAAHFGLDGPCASVAVKSIWLLGSGKVEDLLAQFHPCSGIAEFTAFEIRNLRTPGGARRPQGVMPDPRPNQPWHAVMWDREGQGQPRTKAGNRALASVARWLHLPTLP